MATFSPEFSNPPEFSSTPIFQEPPSEESLLEGLTDSQRQAVIHKDGPALVLAGPGSGKTRVITRRLVWLLTQGIPEHQILAITFTNKAAGEMRARVEALLPGTRLQVSTFHSFGVKFLRQYAEQAGIDRGFLIYDQSDRLRMTKTALEDAGLDDTRFNPDRVSAAISKAKNMLLSPGAYAAQAQDYWSKQVALAYPAYQKRLKQANALDFDDLLYLPAMALRQNAELRARCDARWKYLLVDEYQDTNMAQYALARQLCQEHPNLFVVGDPDQSIYKFRGSDIRNILDFERDYSGSKTILLGANHRSTQSILKAADSLISHNRQRKPKVQTTHNPKGRPVEVVAYENQESEAEGVALRIRDEIQAGRRSLRDFAVLVRMNALTRALEQAFIKYRIPFQIVKGLAFFERKENKDAVAYLRLISNPKDDVSFLRVVNEPARGIGKTSIEHVEAHARARDLSLLEAAGQAEFIPGLTGRAAQAIVKFARLLEKLRPLADGPPHEALIKLLDETGYKAALKKTDDADQDHLANIEELITAARQFAQLDPSNNVAGFLENISLASDLDGFNTSQESVTIMTMHAAKGLEFPVVFMVALEQGLLPHERSLDNELELEEERRLCFVGMTRAMQELQLSYARLREFRGRTTYTVPSSFFDELPPPPDVRKIERGGMRRDESDYSTDHPMDYEDTPIVMAPSRSATAKSAGSSAPFTPRAGEPDELRQGMFVAHGEYGVGQIVEASGNGALRKVRIRFQTAGLKVFLASKAKLTIVHPGEDF